MFLKNFKVGMQLGWDTFAKKFQIFSKAEINYSPKAVAMSITTNDKEIAGLTSNRPWLVEAFKTFYPVWIERLSRQ